MNGTNNVNNQVSEPALKKANIPLSKSGIKLINRQKENSGIAKDQDRVLTPDFL